MNMFAKPKMLRIFAAAVLFIWFASVTACSIHCLGDNCHCDSFKAENANSSHGQSHDSDKNDDSFCLSLHSLTAVSPSTNFTAPNFRLALTLGLLSTPPMFAVEPLEKTIPRQPPDREYVFTPEVCLGAAFRSLAPPSLA